MGGKKTPKITSVKIIPWAAALIPEAHWLDAVKHGMGKTGAIELLLKN